jgi:hypothetical protein
MTTRRLQFEALERRTVLAGNVTAQVVAGALLVTGDDLANFVSVESAGVGKIAVRGFDTQINGQLNAVRIFTNVTGDVTVRLRGGDDLARVTNLVAPANVLIDGGIGNDTLIAGRDQPLGDTRFGSTPSGPLYLPKTLKIFGSDGNDALFQSDAHVDGAGGINLGAGNDTLQMLRPAGSAANVDYGQLSIFAQTGSDAIDLRGLVVQGDLKLDATAAVLTLALRSADVHGNFNLVSGGAADEIDVSELHCYQQFTLQTGGGSDRVRLSAIADVLSANLGDGADRCELWSSNIRSATIHGDSGNDAFYVRYAYGDDALFAGDDGDDVFRDSQSLPNKIAVLRKMTIERNETTI